MYRPMLVYMCIHIYSDAYTCDMYMNLYMCHVHTHVSSGGVVSLRTGRAHEGVSRPV